MAATWWTVQLTSRDRPTGQRICVCVHGPFGGWQVRSGSEHRQQPDLRPAPVVEGEPPGRMPGGSFERRRPNAERLNRQSEGVNSSERSGSGALDSSRRGPEIVSGRSAFCVLRSALREPPVPAFTIRARRRSVSRLVLSMARSSRSGFIRNVGSEARTRTWSERNPSTRHARASEEWAWSDT
jgi:hypothetical protein